MKRQCWYGIFMLILCSFAVQAEETGPSPQFSFGLGLGIGVQNFPNPEYTGLNTEPQYLTYQSLSLSPELGWGKFAIGFSFILNYRFTGGSSGNQFEVRKEDWEVGSFEEFMEIYFPKISYIRYGRKGDPLYVQMGTLENATLGNGFIVGNYSNALYVPETRLFGLSMDIDGSLFSFPYLGIETFVANLARFDLVASRLFTRPLVNTSLPILQNLQVGATVATDREPDYFAKRTPNYPTTLLPPSDANVLIYGIDFQLPLIRRDLFQLSVFGDGVGQKEAWGAMLGTGGKVFHFLTYGAQVRFLQDQFIPTYFGATYDLFRPLQYFVYDGTVEKKGGAGWLASLGFTALQDKIRFTTQAEGPFNEIEGNTFTWRAFFVVKEGVVPGFSFDTLYEKQNMDDWADFLRWREDALIRARINYRTGPALISLVYTLRYDPSVPGDNKWIVTSGLSSTISLY
ncbi:MAG: hypothetical protein SNJ78_04465 [Spirochaetales bacterium]